MRRLSWHAASASPSDGRQAESPDQVYLPAVLLVALLATTGLVFALAAASLPPSTATASPNRTLAPIAPAILDQLATEEFAEFLVVLETQAELGPASALPGKAAKGRAVRDALWETAQGSQGPLIRWLEDRGFEYRAFHVLNAILVRGDDDALRILASRPGVARIEANPRVRSLPPANHAQSGDGAGVSGESSAVMGVEPNIAYVRAPEAWALGATGQGIVIGGQDTGYAWSHPALAAQYRGWNEGIAAHDYNWHDAIHANENGASVCGADSPVPCDDHGHGTHTMGTAVGWDGGSNSIGMAPGARWIGCRNMDNGYGTPASYLECFEFFLAPYPLGGSPAQGNPDLAPDVVINSWSCPASEGCAPGTLEPAVESLRAAGILVVASATNLGPACSTIHDPPAIYAGSLTVGALSTGTDAAAELSSRGPVTIDGSGRVKPDLMAPGTQVRSSYPGGVYLSMSGTSMAGPHVAGAAALVWSAGPWLRGDVTRTTSILVATAMPISSTACSSAGLPNNTYGYGRVDALAAVQAAKPWRVALPAVLNSGAGSEGTEE